VSRSIFHTKLGAAQRTTLKGLVAVILIMVLAATLFSRLFQAYVLEKAEENITNLLLSHKGIHHYVQNTLIPAYIQYQAKGEIPADFYAPELLSSSFIVRNQHVFYNEERKAAGFPELYYKLAANNPRNPVNKADALEKNLIEMFNKNRDIKSYKEIIEIDGKKVLYVAIPFLENSARCLRCHGKREDAPEELQQRYPGQGGFNEKVGEIRAITSIRAPVEHEYTSIYLTAVTIFTGFLGLGGLFFFNSQLRSSVRKKTISLQEEIEERKHSEEMLRKNRSTLKQIMDTTPQSIFWKDINGVFLGCNKVFAQAAGFDNPDQLIGKTDFELPWTREEAEKYRADDREVTSTNRPKMHITEQLQQADGTRIWIDTSKVPLLDGQGRVHGVLGVYEDITKQKEAEADKEELEKRLQHAQKMEAVGTLAGGIAHDFNNILTAILGYGEMVLEELPKDSSLSRNQQQVVRAGNRAKSLVQQILAFSRRTDIDKKPTQIVLIVQEAIKLLHATIPTSVEIREDIEDCGVVFADASQLHQIIMNLCTNAYQAMGSQKGLLGISLHPVTIEEDDRKVHSFDLTPGQYARLEVSDSGQGMDKETLSKIFDPYFTTKDTGKGTGLGLAVVHGLVKSFAGHVSVYSELDRGTRFCVYLPIVEKDPDSETVDATEPCPTGNEKILIVDDEDIIMGMEQQMLEGLGYRVEAFSSATDAWQAFHDAPQQFDLIITDMTMPDMTGADLTRKIKAIRPDIPIILCTGFSELINDEKATALGVCKYLTKPSSRRELARAVRVALDSNKPKPLAV